MTPAGRTQLRRVLAVLAVGPVLLGVWWLKVGILEYRATRPPRRPVVRPELDGELAGMRDVSFRTSDGLTLRGWYVPSHNGAAVVLVHGSGANRSDLLPEAQLLTKRGYGVLMFDLRAHGESEGDQHSYGDRERRDVLAAVELVAAQPDVEPGRIGAVGFSAGGPAVAMAAAVDTRIRAVVLQASTTTLIDACLDEGRLAWLKLCPCVLGMMAAGIDVRGLRTEQAVRALSPRPLLVMYGEKDSVVSPARAQAIYAAAGQPKRLFMVRNAHHGGYFEADPQAYEQALMEHFDAGLLDHAGRARSRPADPSPR